MEHFHSVMKTVMHENWVGLKRRTLPPCLIERIPLELQSKILGEVMKLHDPFLWDPAHVLKLELVSKSWRALTDSPAFWPILRSSYRPALLQKIILKNPNGPLAISVKDDGPGCYAVLGSVEKDYGPRLIQFRWSGSLISWGSIRRYLTVPTPMLERLQLKCSAYNKYSDTHMELLDCRHLRHLTLQNISLSWTSSKLSMLKTLYVRISSDRDLELPPKAFPSLDETVRILSECPRLESLVLISNIKSRNLVHENVDIPSIILPMLKSMTIQTSEDREFSERLTSCITALSCKEFRTYGMDPNELEKEGSPCRQTMESLLRPIHKLQVGYEVDDDSILVLGTTETHGDGPVHVEMTARSSPLSHNSTVPSEGYRDAWIGVSAFLLSTMTDGIPVHVHVSARLIGVCNSTPSLLYPLYGFLESYPLVTSIELVWDGYVGILDYFGPREDGIYPCPLLRRMVIFSTIEDLEVEEDLEQFKLAVAMVIRWRTLPANMKTLGGKKFILELDGGIEDVVNVHELV
jgi:hypothetical protein